MTPGAPLLISTRLEANSLEDFEASFADRVGDNVVFLARAFLDSLKEEATVGTNVRVELSTASGQRALALEGVVAWAYPPHPHAPVGREPGAGILIDRVDEESRALVERMRRRPGAGARVRMPGSRLQSIDVPRTAPPLPAGLFATAEPGPAKAAPVLAPPATTWPSRPAPRLMGLTLDQSFDPTPTPGPIPIPREEPADALPPPLEGFAPLPPTSPSQILDAPTEDNAPRKSKSTTSDLQPSLEALPDAPGTPTGAFEQVPTDVDLLRSLSDADFIHADQEKKPSRPPSSGVNPALSERTVTSWQQLDDLPSAEAELVADDDEQNSIANALADPTTASSPEVSAISSVSAERAAYVSQERTAITRMPPTGDWDARTEHGFSDIPSTAEAQVADASSGIQPRPLPLLEDWPPYDNQNDVLVGVAFLVSHKRQDHIACVEPFGWPRTGTKRWSALDFAREQGEQALDQAVSSSPWLTRDASSDADIVPPPPPPTEPRFDIGHTDPGIRVLDVVGAELAAAQEEDTRGDSVFSDEPEPNAAQIIRPAMRPTATVVSPRPALDDPTGEATVDMTGQSAESSPPLMDEDDVETDRELRRPPTQASAETRARLGVLQRFLGKR